MSEDLEDLYREAELLRRNEKWDEAIAVFTEIIGLEKDPERKASAYTTRGFAYQTTGDYNRAIADCDKAIELKPQDAAAYTARGLVYRFKSDYDRAIADCDKAIELNPQDATAYIARGFAYQTKGDYDRALADYDKAIELNPHDAEAYGARGLVYLHKRDKRNKRNKRDYDSAIADCDKAIELNPHDAKAYRVRGLAYHVKADHDRAIADYAKAIELNPHDAEAYIDRGFEYEYKGNHASALDNFLEAGRRDKSLISNDIFVYIAHSLIGITSDSEERARLFKSYWALADAIREISTELFYEFTDAEEVAHYTSLRGLQALAEPDNPFRLYNSAYMNDPEEGQVFFEIMKKVMKKEEDIDVEAIFYKSDSEDPHSSPAYIGSFVKIESQNDQTKDKLFLWRTYGTHNNEEAGGACLIFNKDQFAQDVPSMKIGTMPRLEYDAKQGESTRQSDLPELYEVVYKSEISKLSESLEKLAWPLKEIEKRLGLHSEKDKKRLIKLVRELLDGIRFLFKADHYREEQEVRVIEMSYDTGGEKPPEHEVAMEHLPPRFYLNIPGNVRFSEVVLGPKTHDVSQWKRYLRSCQGKKVHVRKSKIKFGQADQ